MKKYFSKILACRNEKMCVLQPPQQSVCDDRNFVISGIWGLLHFFITLLLALPLV
jgi:hypothetical protein